MRSPFQRRARSDGGKGPAEPVGQLLERCVLSSEGLRGECTKNLTAEQLLPHDVEVGGVKERPHEGALVIDPSVGRVDDMRTFMSDRRWVPRPPSSLLRPTYGGRSRLRHSSFGLTMNAACERSDLTSRKPTGRVPACLHGQAGCAGKATHNVYTDPTLLGVADALKALRELRARGSESACV